MGKRAPASARELMDLSNEAWSKVIAVYERVRDLNDLMEHFRKEPGGEIIILLALTFFFAGIEKE